jgi:hypothetical protein
MDNNKSKYAVYGLSDEQVSNLKERFGEAVHKSNEEKGFIVVDLNQTDAHNMTMDGYFMKALNKP